MKVFAVPLRPRRLASVHQRAHYIVERLLFYSNGAPHGVSLTVDRSSVGTLKCISVPTKPTAGPHVYWPGSDPHMCAGAAGTSAYSPVDGSKTYKRTTPGMASSHVGSGGGGGGGEGEGEGEGEGGGGVQSVTPTAPGGDVIPEGHGRQPVPAGPNDPAGHCEHGSPGVAME
jgi:hypothetical protein